MPRCCQLPCRFASSIRAVERKRARLQLRNAGPIVRARKLLRIQPFRPIDHGHIPARPPTSARSELNSPGASRYQASPTTGQSQLQSCGSCACRVSGLIERCSSRHRCVPETRLRDRLQFLLVLTLAAARDRCQHHNPIILMQRETCPESERATAARSQPHITGNAEFLPMNTAAAGSRRSR